MFVRCLLVPTAAGVDATLRYQAALMLGRRLGAHIAVLYISPEPTRYLTTLPAVALANGVDLSALKKEFEFDAAAAKIALSAWCGSAGIVLASTAGRLDATFATWTETEGEVEPILALAGRVNDLTIVDRPDPDIPFTNRAFDAAVFSTGRPALMLSKTLPSDLLSHVAIAWDGSLEAARTVGQAMTLIHEADRVTVIQVQTRASDETSCADLADALRWQGIVARTHIVSTTNGRSVGETILAEVTRIDASMLVMGAYTHSRVREFLLGGVTRDVIAGATIPVLMTH
jgi:nucleotide-binding universal stress UspA family protein